MPVVNAIPGAYERIRSSADRLAQAWGIDPKTLYRYFNKTAHFPQSLNELETWGNKVDPTLGYSPRDPNTGAWRYTGGGQPTPGLTDQQRGGFAGHFQNNADDFDIERFQNVNPDGSVFGGSWDANFNQAHPELAGKNGFQTGPMAVVLSGHPAAGAPAVGGGRAAAGAPIVGGVRAAAGAPVAGSRGPTMSIQSVNTGAGDAGAGSDGGGGGAGPTPQQIADAGSVQDWQKRQIEESNGWAPGSLGGSSAPPASAAAPAAPSSAPSASGTRSSTDFFASPDAMKLAEQAGNNAGLLALANLRLTEVDRPAMQHADENEKERLRQEAYKQAYKETYDKIVLTGKMPDGTLIQDAVAQQAKLTGQNPASSVVDRAATAFAQAKAANPAINGSGPEAAAIWQQIVPGLTPEQGAAMAAKASSYYSATGTTMPEDVAHQALSQLTGRPPQSFGQTTPDVIHQQNQDTLSTLQLLASLRGPENAVEYATTLSQIPDSIRQNIQAAMARIPVANRTPAQQGVLGDLGVPPVAGQSAPQPTSLPGVMRAAVMPQTAGLTGAAAQYAASAGSTPGGGLEQWQQSTDTGAPLPAPITTPYQPAPGADQVLHQFSQLPMAPRPGATMQTQSVGAPVMSRDNPLSPGNQPATQAPTVAPTASPTAPAVGPSTVAASAVPPTFGPRTTPAITPANQLSPTEMNRTPDYTRKLLWDSYSNQPGGGDAAAEADKYRRSLPTAVGPRSGRYR